MKERIVNLSEEKHQGVAETFSLKVSISSGKFFGISGDKGFFRDDRGSELCSLNKDGARVMNFLGDGMNVEDTVTAIASENPSIPQGKIKKDTITFIRRLYARGLIRMVGENGEIKIPSWTTEPIENAHLFITHKCNLNCVHCLIVRERRRELGVSDFMNIIDELINLGCTELDITGGEITVKEGFLDIIDYATAKNLSVGVATNGTNWKEHDIIRLISLRPERVNISIYSAVPEVHDEITQKVGSFYKSVDLARELIENDIKVNLKCMIMRRNFATFDTVVELAKSLGAGYQFDSHITSKMDGDPSPLEEALTNSQLWQFSRSPFCFWEGKGKTTTPEAAVCPAGVDRAAINAYGDVYPCPVFPINVGNIRKKSLEEIWQNSPVLKEIREFRFKDFGRCGFCPLLEHCSPCPGASYLEQGDFRESPEWSCNFTKAVLGIQKGGDCKSDSGG